MKILLIAISAALLISATGCKKEAAPIPKVAPAENAATPMLQSQTEKSIPVTKTKPGSAKPENSIPVAEENKEKIPAAQTHKDTAQPLADVTSYARDVTKTQVSKSRNRAQEAEDEMMREAAQRK